VAIILVVNKISYNTLYTHILRNALNQVLDGPVEMQNINKQISWSKYIYVFCLCQDWINALEWKIAKHFKSDIFKHQLYKVQNKQITP
jgi:hypothetical protein